MEKCINWRKGIFLFPFACLSTGPSFWFTLRSLRSINWFWLCVRSRGQGPLTGACEKRKISRLEPAERKKRPNDIYGGSQRKSDKGGKLHPRQEVKVIFFSITRYRRGFLRAIENHRPEPIKHSRPHFITHLKIKKKQVDANNSTVIFLNYNASFSKLKLETEVPYHLGLWHVTDNTLKKINKIK